ncbi:MAG: hypothetical protein Ta2G_04960 [Termitinemataceae bacterium]|nr:MAG: hypothetical protein Ta2G_04960 [Termitinemataceae bacterium]
MENFGIICGVTLGLFGSVFSVVQFFYQRHKDREQVEREARIEKEQAEKEARIEKAQAEKEKAQAEKEARMEKEQAEKDAQRDKALDLKDRLAFLTQVIIDKDIPRESRQPFYDEYIAKGGNGTVIKFWLENK